MRKIAKKAALNFSAQHNLFDPNAVQPVVLIGAGAVGSHVGVALSKLGVKKLKVIDRDSVESHNASMSAYRPCDLARPKVEALREIVEQCSGVTIEVCASNYNGGPLCGSVVCCVDTMEARQLVWKNVKMNAAVDILIDTRVAEKLVWVFAIDPKDPDDIAYYEHHLRYSSKQAAHPVCGKHGIITVSMIAAARACDLLTTWWATGRKERHHKELVGCSDSL